MPISDCFDLISEFFVSDYSHKFADMMRFTDLINFCNFLVLIFLVIFKVFEWSKLVKISLILHDNLIL